VDVNSSFHEATPRTIFVTFIVILDDELINLIKIILDQMIFSYIKIPLKSVLCLNCWIREMHFKLSLFETSLESDQWVKVSLSSTSFLLIVFRSLVFIHSYIFPIISDDVVLIF
jgi:hypothetical protein